jgi:hypothetical protein
MQGHRKKKSKAKSGAKKKAWPLHILRQKAKKRINMRALQKSNSQKIPDKKSGCFQPLRKTVRVLRRNRRGFFND